MDTMIKKKRFVWHAVVGLLLCFSFFNTSAQVVLPKDETGKITYLDVVRMDSLSADTLFRRIKQWVKFTYPKSNTGIDSISRRVVTRGRFLVYTNPGVLKEIHGAIRYDLAIELKENRYRYSFTNFVFEYYKQDRNYKYVATGKDKPLEDEKFPSWQAAWEKHKNTTDAQIKEKIEDLKKAVENKKQETMFIAPVKKTQDW